MRRNCTPVIATYARGERFVCHGGFDPPHQHDRLWVSLPPGFVSPDTERHGLDCMTDANRPLSKWWSP